MKILKLTILLFFLFFYSNSFSNNTKNLNTILILGNSLSSEYGLPRGKGWVNLLNTLLIKENYKIKIFNASISGETSLGGKNRLDNLLKKYKPTIVIIELGGNDGLRGLSLAATQSNFRNMITRVSNFGSKVLLLGMKLPPNYGTDYRKRFFAMYHGLSKENEVTLVPFLLEGLSDTKKYFQPDRIHPNTTAQEIIMRNVLPKLKEILKK
tara:strand:- start:553 stop:1182 length:630 start_codon:yes stop_codon:yes gene_type:complete